MSILGVKASLRSFMPERLWLAAQMIFGILRFVRTERMATFALKVKANRRPLTIQQKILRKMAFDRDPLLTVYADKVKVREYVSKQGGTDYLTTSFGEFSDIKSLSRVSLPRNFVFKSNHGSGASVICWEGVPRGNSLPSKQTSTIWEKYLIHPDDLVWERLVNLSSKWMNANYYWEVGRYPEWAYKDIRPQILVEEVLLHNGQIPEDYKFFMVNGECAFIQVDSSRFTKHKRDLYSPNWDPLNASFRFPGSGLLLERPVCLTEMLSLANMLSKGIDFIRVDLYCTDGGIKFGELTNYPEGGVADLTPKSLSIEYAKRWVQSY